MITNPGPTVAPNKFSDDPAAGALAANLSDTVLLTNGPCRYLYIGVAGDVKVTMLNGDVAVFKSAPVGILRISVQQVWITGTAATNILALY